MARMADEQEFEDYLDTRNCPYCYAEDVEARGSEWSEGVFERFMFCTKCELAWTERYTLSALVLTDADG